INSAPIIVPIWESATTISLERSPITVSIWQSTPWVADVDYYVGLWEELHDCYWSYMRSHNTEKSAQRWPEFVEEWKLLRRFDRVRDCLGLSGPAMFLQPGPEVAICSKALKIILKLLNYLIAPTFLGAEILAEIYNVMM
ncbi:hypothetical protein JMJ77_0009833, partial [Colletotrichum scovillei]